MITKLTIENFKSFGPGSAPVSLGPLNFVVGANASSIVGVETDGMGWSNAFQRGYKTTGHIE